MRGFTATELANNTGDVLMAAAGAPVEIIRYGKPQFVLIRQTHYVQLLEQNRVAPEPLAPLIENIEKVEPKVRQPAKKPKEMPKADANAALELVQALQSWSDE